ncbi:MAG: TonB-dependent siderophore receptor [Hyphomicrobium sp.]|nr:TonB-dependent siderophore receptor [Hyphomicrobium sp.]
MKLFLRALAGLLICAGSFQSSTAQEAQGNAPKADQPGAQLPTIEVTTANQNAKKKTTKKAKQKPVVSEPATVAPPQGTVVDTVSESSTAAETTLNTTKTIGNPAPAYSGGQVATGQSLGLLGQVGVFDVPFSTTAYTEKFIQDQQAQRLSDVVDSNPSIRSNLNRYSNTDQLVVRGFRIDDRSFDGVYGVGPFLSQTLYSIERVEVLLGPSALLNGASPEGAGFGTINYVPKRATIDPVTRVTTSYASDGVVGSHLDVGRRYGVDKEFGARANIAYREGDTAIDNSSEEVGTAAIALDYKGDRFRTTFDFGVQRNTQNGSPTIFGAGGAIPIAPNGSSNVAYPWEESGSDTVYGLLKAEYDLTPDTTLTAAYGAAKDFRREFGQRFAFLTNEAGDYTASISDLEQDIVRQGAQLSLRHRFETGSIGHALALSANLYNETREEAFADLGQFPSNLYNPAVVAPIANPHLGNYQKIRDFTLTGYGLADTMSFFGDRVKFTAGVRYQQIEEDTFDAGTPLNSYEAHAVTPAFGLVVKPLPGMSVYGSYIEGLVQGPSDTEPTSPTFGRLFPPSVNEQKEAGVKYDFGKFGTTVGFFEITQQNVINDPVTLAVSVDGTTINRGVELNVFGEVMPGFRLLGGVTFYNAKIEGSAGGATDGNTPAGVPDVQVNLSAEYDLAFVPGLTVTGRIIYTDDNFLDAENTRAMPDWTRLEAGLRYVTDIAGTPTTFRFEVENLTDEQYWNVASDSFFSLGGPRTYYLSMTTDF